MQTYKINILLFIVITFTPFVDEQTSQNNANHIFKTGNVELNEKGSLVNNGGDSESIKEINRFFISDINENANYLLFTSVPYILSLKKSEVLMPIKYQTSFFSIYK
ncbi:hypothetical protein ACE1TI_18800 [Alteribacillus sp. JSM 102045]|uniref:hypothetical protein n=1 Tax=Alteribacillus sp. JSM 102045 TaxID=1562101 RepID=UPI0035BED304